MASRTSPPKRKPARTPAKGVRKAVRRATRGDRPYQFGLVILLFVLLSMAWAPIKNLTAGSERIDQLVASRDALAAEVDKLEDRKDQLMDPEELELIAREEYGLVKPGEIPYVVVTAEPDPQLGPVETPQPPSDLPWYRRVWSSVSELWD